MNNCTHMHTHTDIIHIYIYIPAHSHVIRYNIILLHWTFTFCGHLKARRCENCFEMNARPLCFSRTVSTGQVWKQVEKLLVAWSCLRMHWQAAGINFCGFFLFSCDPWLCQSRELESLYCGRWWRTTGSRKEENALSDYDRDVAWLQTAQIVGQMS